MARRIPRLDAFVVATIALVLLGIGALSFERRMFAVEPVLGVEWVQAHAGPVALWVEPGSPAWGAGMLPGDILERAAGRSVTSALEAAELPWEAGERLIDLEIRRGDRTLRLAIRPTTRRGAPDVYLFLAVVALAFLASAALISLRSPAVRGGRIYTFLGACLYAVLVLSHSGRGDRLDWLIYWVDIAAGAFAPSLLIHLASALSRRSTLRRRAALAFSYAGSLAIVVLAVWLVGLGGVYRFPDPVSMAETTDRLEVLFLALAVLGAAYLLARSHARSASGLHRSQMRFMLWGLGVGLAPLVTIYGIPWALGATVPSWVEFVSVVPLLVVPASFTAALVRYRLHDLDLLLRRGVTEVSAVLCILAVYAAGKAVLGSVLTGLLPLSNSGLRYLSILLAAIAYPKVREWVQWGVDRAFYRKRYSYRATLLDFGRELNAETDLPAIVERLEQRVRQTLDVGEARVLVRTGADHFESVSLNGPQLRIELDPRLRERCERERQVLLGEGGLDELPQARYLFGMRVKGSLRAVLATSERQGRDESLTSEDRALLSTLSAHAAAAIEAARLLREVRQQAAHVELLQARQERILESSAVGLLLMDGDHRILAWNRALEEMYGMAREKAVGRRLGEVFPLHMTRRIDRELAGSTGAEEIRIYRHTLVNHRGQRIVANLSVSEAGREEAKDGARVVSFDDVTGRVKLEEQMLRQERLASLGLLAAGVAHEVNTPLTGISSYAQMLAEELDPDDPRREILEKIEVESQRASFIANSLLNLARPESVPHEEISLNDAVREVLHLFEPQIRGRGIRVESSLDPALPKVRGHRGKMQQVLLNLLLNARDAVAEQGRIAVSTRSHAGRVVLEVQDDGVGIAEEDLPRIFDPFFTTKGRGRGTGLGLLITHGIVEEHQGEMGVESTPGEFTRFRVELPASRASEALA